MPTISIIVPVYNVEKFIRRCADSILAQTFTDFELILVDDGSPDNSGAICDEYAAKDTRIHVIHKENGGVSSARNAGLDFAKGKYIAFVDGDDYVSPDYLEELTAAFERNDADAVFMEYNRVEPESNLIHANALPELCGSRVDDVMRLSQNDMFGYACVKAFRKEYIGQLRFDEQLDLYEDEVFSCAVFQKDGRIGKVSKPIYNYVRRSGSAVERARQNYCVNCEAVYLAWKALLPEDRADCRDFLQSKADHMAGVCKFYGMEQPVKPGPFFRKLSQCAFIRESGVDDGFVQALRQENLTQVMCMCMWYKVKNYLKRALNR